MNWISWALKPPPPEQIVQVKHGLFSQEYVLVRRCDLHPEFNIADIYWRPVHPTKHWKM